MPIDTHIRDEIRGKIHNQCCTILFLTDFHKKNRFSPIPEIEKKNKKWLTQKSIPNKILYYKSYVGRSCRFYTLIIVAENIPHNESCDML